MQSAKRGHENLFTKYNFTSEQPPKKKARAGPNDNEKQAEETVHKLIFQFVNNAGLSDRTATNQDLRNLILFTINNASLLKNYRHLGKFKFVSIRLNTFNEFKKFVTDLVAKIRKWYRENTVSSL